MTRSRRHFIDEFKRETVRLAGQPDSNVSRGAQDLGLDPSVLRRWVGQMRGGTREPTPGKPLKSAQQQEIGNHARVGNVQVTAVVSSLRSGSGR